MLIVFKYLFLVGYGSHKAFTSVPNMKFSENHKQTKKCSLLLNTKFNYLRFTGKIGGMLVTETYQRAWVPQGQETSHQPYKQFGDQTLFYCGWLRHQRTILKSLMRILYKMQSSSQAIGFVLSSTIFINLSEIHRPFVAAIEMWPNSWMDLQRNMSKGITESTNWMTPENPMAYVACLLQVSINALMH